MRRISDTFEKLFVIHLPAEMLSGDNLIPIGLDLKPHREIQLDDAWLLASDIAAQNPPPVVMSFMDSFAFEEMLCGKVRPLEVVEVSDFSQYTIVLTDDQIFTKTYKYREALLNNPDFEGKFHDVMNSL